MKCFAMTALSKVARSSREEVVLSVEKTDTDRLTGKMALAHKIEDKSSARYQKGQLIDKRR